MQRSNKETLQLIERNDPELKVVFFHSYEYVDNINNIDVTDEIPGLEFIRKVVDALNSNKYVTSLSFNSSYIGDDCALELGRLRCPTLTEISLQNNNFTSKGAIEIAKIPHLRVLNVSYNGIDDEGAVALSAMESLEKLNISFNQVGNNGLIALLKNTSIKKLKIEGNAFNASGLKHVFNNSTLFSIKARNNEITQDYHQKVLDHVSTNEHPPTTKCSIQ